MRSSTLREISFGGDAQRRGLFETFHVDDTYTELPASATVLSARQLPPSGGGDTRFLDMRVAYELLDADMQRRLQGRASHTPTTTRARSRRGSRPAGPTTRWSR